MPLHDARSVLISLLEHSHRLPFPIMIVMLGGVGFGPKTGNARATVKPQSMFVITMPVNHATLPSARAGPS